MTTKLKASLQCVMQDWLDKNCEDEGRPDGFMYEAMSLHMTNAAEAVWDATFDGQEKADRELSRT